MSDPQKPIPAEDHQAIVESASSESASTESEQTLPPSEANTHKGSISDETLQPSASASSAEPPVDQTIPPSSGASAETSAEVASDQTLQPGGAVQVGGQLDSSTFGDYEIIQEIARGGMGVVYKARQVSLNRTVALKKILSGQLAGEEDLKRFQVEAEASAQLDHVGIVPVYDFGQVDGQYFFSMGFIEGDDLAERIRERPMEAEAAAEMMIKIAQAVGYANAQGVIHRDLKPSNVLLDAQNEPKVTDFGVAKQQGSDSEMTAQGQILGTPSYMPPEQAAGQGDVVDQRADVYALGAILYALLTGRPPFQAATAMETMIQVLDQDPVPISQLNSTIPRDLETICLKCLQKDQARRYASAEALAEDLQRYLDDEPIVARPPSKTEQLARWVRKNRATAIATGVVAASLLVATIISISFAVEAGRQRDLASDQRDAAEIAKQEADKQRVAADQAKEEAKKNASEATQRANELQQIADFQANQLANVNPRRMGQTIRKMVIDQSRAARQRTGKNSSELESEIATLERLLKGADFTGIALKVLDKQIFAGAIEELDNFENQPLVQARLLQVVSDTLRALGLFEQAVGPQIRALEIRKRELLPSDPNRLDSVNSYGILLKERGAYEAAEPLLREALKYRQKTLGDCDSDTLVSMQELSQLLMTQRRLSEAETTLRNSLEVLREKLGDNHPETLKAISQLASLVKLADKRKEAVALLREALATCRRLKGENHIDTYDAQLELGNLLIWENLEAAGEYEKITRKILDELEKDQDDKANLTSVKALELLIDCLMNQMKFKEKLEAGRELITRCRLAFGDEHTKTLDAMKSYATNGLLTENWASSERVLKEVLAIERPKLGGQNEQTLSTMTLLAMVLASQDKNQEAENLYREAFDGFTALNQEQVAKTVGGELGSLVLKRGDVAAAEPLLLAAWSLYEDMEDLYYMEEGVQVDVLELYIAKGDYDAAESLQRKVLEGLVREKCTEESINKARHKLDSILAARKAANSARETKKEAGKPDEPSNDRPLGKADSPLDSLSPGLNEIRVEHEGRPRRLLITTPQSLEAGRPYPALFCFHGAGGKADGQSKRWSRHADPHNLIVVSFEAVQPMAKWNFKDEFHAVDHDDVGLVVDFAKGLITAGFADPRAIYATGHSSGGLFCYRLAKQTDLFAAFAPMSCGMVKGAHTPTDPTQPVSILQVIGDQDKSFHGSTNPKVTMYSAAQRIDLWRTFNGCAAQPVITRPSEEVALSTYTNEAGIEVVLCEVKGEGHHLRSDLRDETDVIALDFLLKHRRDSGRSSDEAP